MKKQKYTWETAVLILFFLTVLPCQQFLIKHLLQKTVPPPPVRFPEDNWSDSALCGNAGALMQMVMLHLKKNSPEIAEEWLKFGCMELRAPSVMLFYGDWLRQKGDSRRAAYFYRFALKKGREARAPQAFLRALEERLKGVK